MTLRIYIYGITERLLHLKIIQTGRELVVCQPVAIHII